MTETQTPDAQGYLSHRQILVVMSGLMAGMFLGALDQSIAGDETIMEALDHGRVAEPGHRVDQVGIGRRIRQQDRQQGFSVGQAAACGDDLEHGAPHQRMQGLGQQATGGMKHRRSLRRCGRLSNTPSAIDS